MSNNGYIAPSIDALTTKDRVQHSQPLYKGVANVAENLGRRGMATAEAEALNEAVWKLTSLCYQKEGRLLCNVDRHTGRIYRELPVPWSGKNYKRYGLRSRNRADVLRYIMMRHAGYSTSLFLYDSSARRWHVNLADYPTFELAQQWLRKNEISGQMWLTVVAKLNE